MGREFELGDVLTVTTEIMMCRRGMDGVYEILDYLTEDELCTHQIPRAMRACRDEVLAQCPSLADIVPPEFKDHEDMFVWLGEMELRLGNSFELNPITSWEHQEPTEEACDLMGPERVFVHEAEEDKEPEGLDFY